MFRSSSIVVHLLIVHVAIDFDDEAFLSADEVDDVAFEGNLAAEAETVELPAAECVPEFLLGSGGLFTQMAGEGVEFFGRVAVAGYRKLPPLTPPSKPREGNRSIKSNGYQHNSQLA